MKILLFIILTINNQLFEDTSKSIKIIEKLISYSDERKRLSIEYLKDRHGIIQDNANITPIMVVLHYTGKGTAKSIYNYFNQTTIETDRKINSNQSKLNVSSHYVIDRDGTIYRLVPDNLFCRHTIGLNYCAIGVENIGSKENPLTNEQIKSNAKLIRYLKSKHNIQYVIGHSEYAEFKNSNLWRENNKNYFTHKEDPGDSFLREVRKLISDLSLKNKP